MPVLAGLAFLVSPQADMAPLIPQRVAVFSVFDRLRAKPTFLDSDITAQKCTIAVLVGTGVVRRFLQHLHSPSFGPPYKPLQLTQTKADEGGMLATKRRRWYGRRRAISLVF